MRRTSHIQGVAKGQNSAARGMGGAALERVGLLLTTSPWQAPAELRGVLVDHIGNLQLGGWTVREAHIRNYLLWRSATRQRAGAPVIVLPRFSRHVPRRAMNTLVLADLLAAERRLAKHQAALRLTERQSILSVRETGLEPEELMDLASELLVSAVQKNWLL